LNSCKRKPFEIALGAGIYYIEIDPGTVFKGESHEGNVYEYVFVISGKMQISVEEKEFEINEGEFLQFQANCPHAYRCIGRKTATAIMQISYLS
jgi:quercetin dioxygenase-like cupin family protein